jgi:hypothetical protein
VRSIGRFGSRACRVSNASSVKTASCPADAFALNQIEQFRGWRLIRKADDEELTNLLV